MTFDAMWETLLPLGRDASTGGYRRFAWTPVLRECEAWFVAEAERRDLRLVRDGNGNMVAWWWPGGAPTEPSPAQASPGPTDEPAPTASTSPSSDSIPPGGIVTGSHLDSVPDGGAFDGPLGVVTALAAIDLLRDRGVRPGRPVGVAVFAEEEGTRFGRACLGSRLMTGALPAAEAKELRDADGVFLLDAMERAGVVPRLGPSLDLLAQPAAFVELHIEQGRGLVDLGAPVGLASRIWPHGRWRFRFVGEANHAGTTRMEDRRDPMLTYAMTALAANKRARLASGASAPGARATFGRVEVEPGGVNAIPAVVTAWLDARAATDEVLDAVVDEVGRQAGDRAHRDGTILEIVGESRTPDVAFDPALRERLAHRLGGVPVLATQAGHDAGILAAAGIPTAMLFVRNPTGVSHAPAEHAEPADCWAGVEALATVLADLAGCEPAG